VLLLFAVTVEAAIVSIFDPNVTSSGMDNGIAAKLVLQAMLAATLVGVAFAMASANGRPVGAAGLGLRRPRPGALRLAATAYVAYLAFALAYSQIVNPHQKDITRDLGYGHSVLASIVAGILIVAAAPVSEEIFFRGFVFGGFRNRWPVVVAAIASALIFGAFHYTGVSSLTVLPQLAALGLVLAWLYQRTGSILPTIALHVLNNAVAFALIVH
jgi:membrane protease YdiL (CAAX protease family)